MKRKVAFVPLLTLSCVAALLALRATGRTMPGLSSTPSSPALECPASIDLGAHSLGDRIVAPVRVANRGGQPLIIDNVRSDCSCAGLELTEGGRYAKIESLVIPPGVERTFVTRIVLNSMAGRRVRHVIRFRTNDPDRPEWELEVVVPKVTGGLMLLPSTVALGDIARGEIAHRVIEVRDSCPHPRSVESATVSDPNRLTARLLPVSGDGDDATGGRLLARIELAIDTAELGPVDGTVVVRLSGEGVTLDEVRVHGRVVGHVQLFPPNLVLPRASGDGWLYESKCIAQSTGGKPFTLTTIALPPGITAESSGVGATHVIAVRCDPKLAKTGDAGKSTVVRLRAKFAETETEIELPVECRPAGGSQ